MRTADCGLRVGCWSVRVLAFPDACKPAARSLSKANSSIGRAPVSKTGGWGFDSLLACQLVTE